MNKLKALFLYWSIVKYSAVVMAVIKGIEVVYNELG
jgi:hypothetical protein